MRNKVMATVQTTAAVLLTVTMMTMAAPAVHAETADADQNAVVQCESVVDSVSEEANINADAAAGDSSDQLSDDNQPIIMTQARNDLNINDIYSLPNGHYTVNTDIVYADDDCVAIIYNGASHATVLSGRGIIFIKNPFIWSSGHALTQINGTPLSDIIVDHVNCANYNHYKEGCVSSIRVEKNYFNWFYDYTLYVNGYASEASREFNLRFFDSAEGDEQDYYNLHISDSDDKEHFVWFNSSNPYLSKISWVE